MCKITKNNSTVNLYNNYGYVKFIMTSQYKKFTKLLVKWPVDASKGERDLGKFIRDKVKAAFESTDKVNLDSELCNRQYNSLTKLADNHYRNKYKRSRHSTATGLSTEECQLILSTEVLDYLKEENKGFFRKILNKD